jgi:hypothetical protein
MPELGTSGSVGGEGGNLLVYPASVGEQVLIASGKPGEEDDQMI